MNADSLFKRLLKERLPADHHVEFDEIVILADRALPVRLMYSHRLRVDTKNGTVRIDTWKPDKEVPSIRGKWVQSRVLTSEDRVVENLRDLVDIYPEAISKLIQGRIF